MFEKVEWEWGEENNTVMGTESRSPAISRIVCFGGGNTENRRERKLLAVFS